MSMMEAMRERAEDLMRTANVMSSKPFTDFVKAEAELIAYIYGQCESDCHEITEAFFDDALTALGRCINKSMTFKLVPKS